MPPQGSWTAELMTQSLAFSPVQFICHTLCDAGKAPQHQGLTRRPQLCWVLSTTWQMDAGLVLCHVPSPHGLVRGICQTALALSLGAITPLTLTSVSQNAVTCAGGVPGLRADSRRGRGRRGCGSSACRHKQARQVTTCACQFVDAMPR